MSRFKHPLSAILMLLVLLGGATLIASNAGAINLSLKTLWFSPMSDPDWQIWVTIRLPRILLAILVGLALAVAGAIMQGLFRNPLADPSLLGISSGAALCVAAFIVLSFSLPTILQSYGHLAAAFIGSLTVSLIIFSLNRISNGNLARLLLAGIAINALCMSLIGVLSYVSNDQQLRTFSLWMMGSLGNVDWTSLTIAASIILPTCFVCLWQGNALNILQLGDEDAHYLGLNVERSKFILLFLSALLIGCAVAMSGVIGFVGLVVPHLIRMTLGPDHRWLIPGSAIVGATLLLIADTLARTLVVPAEIPVGLLTGLIGGPYFLWLILRQPAGRF
ncbi:MULTISPECIES: FecCD family ABC transporter permease [Providencia]|uniref:Iron chelate uptake ABC transporter, FeCT family, permease protein n=1 Tax=Providencia rustigianii DSM 4541 TaxID=500637 RepID=D1P3N7_9GAMM|nr:MULTISPECIES: iron ABC transporter permease [Providencia]EFB72153.1 iron chelate uptake ABC transporter, FeCT family, permease protein [Providencia rustigianii DSM 4541]MTC55296.1 iron chelate uptake ABC transporter family permease subunit [Providencia rustigianii]SUC27888.1 Probable siderophore transport system permease protein yfhA [Providencia rustigianii]